MLTDETTIKVRAGRGGDGVVRFSGVMKTNAPTGGDGGCGGNVIFLGVADLGALRAYRSNKVIEASDGGVGQQNTKKGHNGKDVFIRVPVGTVIRDKDKEKEYEVMHIGEKIVVARGGKGGFGNFHFRSSRVTTPKKATPGSAGEECVLDVELRLIADIGFVGYPNVGKSTLLNTLTKSSSKVGNYQFTTLEPNLGSYYGTILADIPGIIEGASKGRGLGYKFLRHIERTRILFHLVSAMSENPVDDYVKIRQELGAYNKKLLEKPEWVFVSQSDECDPKKVKKAVKTLKDKNPRVIPISILDDDSIQQVRKIIDGILAQEVTEEEDENKE
jgi:GTP-binding protein